MGSICGGIIDYKLVYEAEDRSSFLELDQRSDTLSLKPGALDVPGTYTDILLSFFYTQFPFNPTMDVRVIATVEGCNIGKAYFVEYQL